MKKLTASIALLALLTGLLLCGCKNSAGDTMGSSTGTTEPIQLESGKEIKIAADGKVTAGDTVISQGGAGSVATGCEITVKEDGTIIVTTDEGDYSVCKNYEITIPAKTEQAVQVSTPTGEIISTKGSGVALGGVTVKDTGAVQMSQGTVTKEAGKVVFSTKNGDYIIKPENALAKAASACQVQKPDGTVVQVNDALTILDGKAQILADGTVKTGQAAVSMLEETAVIATTEGVYTVTAEEIVVAEETKVLLPVAVLDPFGEVISDGKAVIQEGSICVTEEGNLITNSGTVTVDNTGVTVTPIKPEKTMTLPNGAVIDITNATTLEDGTVAVPAEMISVPGVEILGSECHYSPNGMAAFYDYYTEDGRKVAKDHPQVAQTAVFIYDMRFKGDPLVSYELIDHNTNTVIEKIVSTIDSDGYVIEQKQWALYASEYTVCGYDRYGRQTRWAVYNDDGALQKPGIIEYEYLVDSAYDLRYKSILTYNIYGVKERYEEYDAEGNSAYVALYDENGALSGEMFYINGKQYLGKAYRADGGFDYETIYADGTRDVLYTLPNGHYTLTKYDQNDRVLRYQGFQADGSSLGYDEYSYNVDGWISIHRAVKFNSEVLVNQDGSVSGRLNVTEYYESETKVEWIQYNEDGSVFARGEHAKT